MLHSKHGPDTHTHWIMAYEATIPSGMWTMSALNDGSDCPMVFKRNAEWWTRVERVHGELNSSSMSSLHNAVSLSRLHSLRAPASAPSPARWPHFILIVFGQRFLLIPKSRLPFAYVSCYNVDQMCDAHMCSTSWQSWFWMADYPLFDLNCGHRIPMFTDITLLLNWLCGPLNQMEREKKTEKQNKNSII